MSLRSYIRILGASRKLSVPDHSFRSGISYPFSWQGASRGIREPGGLFRIPALARLKIQNLTAFPPEFPTSHIGDDQGGYPRQAELSHCHALSKAAGIGAPT